MRTSALGRVVAALTTSLVGAALLAAPARAVEPDPPVAVDDTITLYPGQAGVIDVLANDSAPSGDALALCRFPTPDLTGMSKPPAILAVPAGDMMGGGPGEVFVEVSARARGTHVINYYICDTHRLTPAHLTVVVREVEPVDVVKVKSKPGRLRITNHNGKGVRFWYGDPRADRPDGKLKVPAGATRTIRVQRHRIVWIAFIGSPSGKGGLTSLPAIIDQGVVRNIKLKGAPLPAPEGSGGSSGSSSGSGSARWAPSADAAARLLAR